MSAMKLCKQQQHQLVSKSTISRFLHSSNVAPLSDSIPILSDLPSLKPKPKNPNLTRQELTKINLLIPRLCLSNHLPTALNLIITSISTNPPPKSISFSILIHSLTSEPDLTLPMALLNKLKPTPQYLNSVTASLINSFLKKGRPRDAFKVYNWMIRPGSPCVVEPVVYGVLVNWFCMNGFNLEALKVIKDMVGNNLVPGEKLKMIVFRSLLREARVVEAKKLNEALTSVRIGGAEGVRRLLDLLDQLVADWTE